MRIRDEVVRLNERWRDLIKKDFIEEVKAVFVLIFGSYAKGNVRDESDLDIAYYADKKLSPYERFIYAQKLADTLGMEIDLVDIREVDTVFAAQIFSTGEVIYCRDESIFNRERMKALSMYAHLNEQRAEILQGIMKRGSIYE